MYAEITDITEKLEMNDKPNSYPTVTSVLKTSM